MMKKPEIEEITDKKFIKLYDFHFETKEHYYVASRHNKKELTASLSDEEYKGLVPDAVSCVVIVKVEGEEERLVLSREYRYPIRRFVYSPPAGLIDKADLAFREPRIEAARREIFEETGIHVTENDRITVFNPATFSSVGMTDESTSFVLAYVTLPDLSCLTHDGAEDGEIFDGFYLVTRREALSCIRSGRDPEGGFFPVQGLTALLIFASGLWKEE